MEIQETNPISRQLKELYHSNDVRLVVDGETWPLTGLNFKLKEGRVEATAFAIPPHPHVEQSWERLRLH